MLPWCKTVWKSTSELGYAETFVNLHAIELPQLRGQRRVDGVDLHAIEQMQLRGRRRVDGVGRPKFDFHTVDDDGDV